MVGRAHPTNLPNGGDAADLLLAQPEENPLGNRGEDRRADVLKKYGGDRKTERAVADGLAWLAAHQRRDGVWDRGGFDQLCPADDRCSQTALGRLDYDCDVGVSALAALAFLGAGYTHEQGRYSETLTKAFNFILAQQDPTGSFAHNSGLQMYNDAIATLAVAEAYALTKDRAFLSPLTAAVRHLERSQQKAGGWDYTADASTGRNDSSVTGWVMMALKAAQAAGVEPAVETRFRLLEHFDRATDPGGRVWYSDKGIGIEGDPKTGQFSRRYGPAVLSIGLYSRSALGLRLDDDFAHRQAAMLLDDLPDLKRLRGGDPTGLHSEYYWYYGTLAMFNRGGEDWRKWNEALRRTVMEYQERPTRKDGTKRHAYGSWPAFGRDWGKWGRSGSRIYSTAINTLTLEIYYRYVPAFMSPAGLIGPKEMRKAAAGANPRQQRALLDIARRLHPDTAEPVLLDFLDSRDENLHFEAALALTALGSPVGKAALLPMRAQARPEAQRRIDDALKAYVEPAAGVMFGQVRLTEMSARMFLFDTKGQRVYYRQKVIVLRDGRQIAVATVNRRFTAHDAAAAQIIEATDEVQEGDTVRSVQEKDKG